MARWTLATLSQSPMTIIRSATPAKDMTSSVRGREPMDSSTSPQAILWAWPLWSVKFTPSGSMEVTLTPHWKWKLGCFRQ